MHNNSTAHKEPPLEELSDAQLLRLFQVEKNQESIGILYNRYRHLVYGLSYRYFRNREESEDMVHYVFSLLIQKLPAKEVHSFKQYLYGTVRNECLAKNRQIKKESERQNQWAHFEKNQHSFMEFDATLHLSNEQSLEDAVQEAMKALGKEQQICIFQFFFEGKSYKEIADITGFELKKVKSYLQNGKRNLKKMLEEKILDQSS